jgi:3-methyl-2-oxobutanoate hydroxymethyltransferase
MQLHDFKRYKLASQKIAMLTCYDYPSACILAETKVDCVLVGDSVAMTVHGHESTIMATIEMMALHTKAVARGLSKQFLVTDLPFLCHRASQSETIQAVKTLLLAGAQAIKIEGGDEDTCKTIAYLIASGVPVMGHIGLTPQSILQLGGYKVQGKETATAKALLEQAQALQAAGCFAIVLECIPSALAKVITEALDIPTIGIGAGSDTDGQILVWHDLLGLQLTAYPKFVKKYANTHSVILNAVNQYIDEVQAIHYPSLEHTY